MEKLSYDDITILVEAIDAWTSRDFGGEIMLTMLDSMIGGNTSAEHKAKMAREKNQKETVKKAKKEREKEIAILIKAKLVIMKQEIVKEQVNVS